MQQSPSKRAKPDAKSADIISAPTSTAPTSVFSMQVDTPPNPSSFTNPSNKLVKPKQAEHAGLFGASGSKPQASVPKPIPKPQPLPKPAKQEPEIIVLDDDDDEDENMDVVKPSAPVTRQRPGHQRRSSIHRIEDVPIVVEEMEDGDGSFARSPSPSPTKGPIHVRASSVEEVDEEGGSEKATKSSRGSRPAPLGTSRSSSTLAVSNGFGPGSAFKSTSPVVPSPLRHVSLPPADSSEEENDSNTENQKPATDSVSTPDPASSPKSRARHLPLQDLTSFEVLKPSSINTIKSSVPHDKGKLDARSRAAALPESELKVFDLRNPAPAAFDWSAAGFKPQATSSKATWMCDSCMLQSPMEEDQCVICKADKPLTGSPAPMTNTATPNPTLPTTNGGAFNWAAAGMKAPISNGTWTCNTCMVQSPADADKCVACETSKNA